MYGSSLSPVRLHYPTSKPNLTHHTACYPSNGTEAPTKSPFSPLSNAKKTDAQGVAVLSGHVIAKTNLL
jgi:hypothetical protein